MKKKRWIIIGVVVLVAVIGVAAAAEYGKYRMGLIPEMSFEEVLNYTTRDNPDAVITVGVIEDGKADYTVYGENGTVLPKELHTYEIGSLTKTITASMVCKAVQEGKLELDASIDQYLELPPDQHYPTIKQLMTHKSGYNGYYFETPMIQNFLKGRNDFYGIGDSMVLARLEKTQIADREYDFCYSNFGYATLGLILEKVYQTEYTTLMNTYLTEELGLAGSRMSDGNGDLGNYWDWMPGDTYMAAGAVLSNIEDMLAYAQMQLEGTHSFDLCHQSLYQIDASSESYKTMGIYMDEVAYAWMIDTHNGIIWHNGGTGDYNCYLGIQPEKNKAVVVLSNLPPKEKIPATVLGIKRLTGDD
jgi:CubicO group peptidase (beta-lactamase class C family)